MYDISQSTMYQKYLRGDSRVDGFKSDWRIEQERRRKEELGQRKFVTDPQISARQERTPVKRIRPKAVPRHCELCPKVIRSFNKTGRCIEHQAKQEPKVKDLCPPCGRPMRSDNSYGICKHCYNGYRRLIHQEKLITCDECFQTLYSNNTTGKCMKHAKALHKRNDNASRRARQKLLRAA